MFRMTQPKTHPVLIQRQDVADIRDALRERSSSRWMRARSARLLAALDRAIVSIERPDCYVVPAPFADADVLIRVALSIELRRCRLTPAMTVLRSGLGAA